MIERAGEAAKLPFPVHVHMVRHSTGYALANRGTHAAAPALPWPRQHHEYGTLYRDVA
jgi:hypothetical protein